jgi:hypothetical protein
VSQKELYKGIRNVIVWRVLTKHLHLKAYKLSFVQDVEQRIVYTALGLTFLDFKYLKVAHCLYRLLYYRKIIHVHMYEF